MEAKKEAKSNVRRVKNPETFRERAVKGTTAKETPKRSSKILKAPFRGLRKLLSPLGKGYRSLKQVKALKPLFFVLRMIGLVLLPKYVRSSFKELKLVAWPSMRQSLKLTYAVLAFAVVFGSAVALLDYGLDKVFKSILLK